MCSLIIICYFIVDALCDPVNQSSEKKAKTPKSAGEAFLKTLFAP